MEPQKLEFRSPQKLEFRSPPTLSWEMKTTPAMQPVKVELKTAPRIERQLQEFVVRPFDYQPVQIFVYTIDTSALKTRDEPRS